MARPSDRPMMLYHETHQSKLRAVHCVNAVLQGPFFFDHELTDLASYLMVSSDEDDDVFDVDVSHIVSLGGHFCLQVVRAALEVWNLHVIPIEDDERAKIDPGLENAFICHRHNKWVCARRVGGEWYSFDGTRDVPERLPKHALSAYFDALRDDGWGVFAVRGDLPDECPVSLSLYGKWVLPEDARGAKKSRIFGSRGYEASSSSSRVALLLDEEEDLKAAIAASLRGLEMG
ncbi:hypothetical protein QJS04_geneDACA011422 [Acorus gramineus]|uniref:ubiquitinyl hydrolase 1 n=1 Tax=Acorus gramineus TaxID=55184 RepID=A0AAV9AKL0_ACOGR|nr:hypothetical protein QJS04_geneDACA011422 [Acorus gramineus]